MKVEKKALVAVLSAGLLTGCGASELDAAPGLETVESFERKEQAAVSFPPEAIRLALVSIRWSGGDPGSTHLQVKLELDDALIRAAYPDFDGLESVYVDIPGRVPGWNGRRSLKYRRTDGTADVYLWSGDFTTGLVDTWEKPFVFGLSTNVGVFHGVGKVVKIYQPIDDFQ